MHVCTASCIYLWGPRLRISNPQVIAGISTRRVGRKASIVESLGVFLGGSGLWVGCNHVCDASQQPILNPTLILQWFWRKLSKLVMGAYCDKRNVNKGGNHDGTLTRYRSITAAEPCAVVILEACPVVTPWIEGKYPNAEAQCHKTTLKPQRLLFFWFGADPLTEGHDMSWQLGSVQRSWEKSCHAHTPMGAKADFIALSAVLSTFEI